MLHCLLQLERTAALQVVYMTQRRSPSIHIAWQIPSKMLPPFVFWELRLLRCLIFAEIMIPG